MKALDALLPIRHAGTEQRYSFSQWLQDVLAVGMPSGVKTTYGENYVEQIGDNYASYVTSGLRANPIISAVELLRFSVFSEARFCWQRMQSGRPGGVFSSPALAMLETPWPGGTTGDLLSRMILDADLAGNSYVARVDDELVVLRPDWTEILLSPRDVEDSQVSWRRVGYVYWEGGRASGSSQTPRVFLPGEVAHFAPYPDPLAEYRGMSWLTPVLREVQSDIAATQHKLKFFENAATPNMVVKFPKEVTPTQYREFSDAMDARTRGTENAYETLYLSGGADATVVGSDLRSIDFKSVQGAGETRIAAAAGVPAVLAGLSEGLQGSSLNEGNYRSARKRFADATMRPLWRNACGSLQQILPAPAGARLWWDGRDVAFLRDDETELAEIQAKRASTIRTLVDAGYSPESVIAAVDGEDLTLLVHSGLYSVQLQAPGTTTPAA